VELDLVVTGGDLADGTGAPLRRADVGIASGRVVAIDAPGSLAHQGAPCIDAAGRVVAPGFIDVHTHHDAQVFWDPALTPSCLHGVTTVMAGNCGFTLAPFEASEADYLMRMMARVEGIPLAALQAGVPWDWRSTAEYLDRVEHAGPALNMGFLVGHSALRRVVMGDAAVGNRASDDQLARMRQLLDEGLAAGGFGFSSSWGVNHYDAAGDPVPSRHASPDELVALAGVVAGSSGTQIEFVPGEGFGADDVDLMVRMSLAAQRPLNWNILLLEPSHLERAAARLAASDEARRHGADVRALSYPGPLSLRLTFLATAFQRIPGWTKAMALPPTERKALFADPDGRARLASTIPPREQLARFLVFEDLIVTDTFTDATAPYRGRRVGDIAFEQGRAAFDVVADIIVADDLRTCFLPTPDEDDASWAMRVATWQDDRVIIGASDAGAHVDTISSFDFTTAFLALNRERGAMPVEEAVRRLTSVPATLYGLKDRGRLVPGGAADLVIFDPDTVAPGRVEWRTDLPGGAGRLYGEATGIERVLVNGVEIVVDGALSGARPGVLLRSGQGATTPVPSTK
jgi:N-acyl-D-aspartate/D-glutamate deacylase